MSTRLEVPNLKSWNIVADKLLLRLHSARILLLVGDLGAGKTTLVKEIMKALDYDGHVDSPTFSLIQSYDSDPVVHHLDLYRIEEYEELLEIGIEELLQGEEIIIVEWPELLESAIEEPYIKIEICVLDSGERNVVISTID